MYTDRKGLYILILIVFIFSCRKKEAKLEKLINKNNLSFPQLMFSKVRIVSVNASFDKEKNKKYTFLNKDDIISLYKEGNEQDFKVIDLDYIQIEQLLAIFRPTPCKTEDIPTKDCVPEFRDAIVFSNSKNDIVAYVSICFNCESFIFKPDLSSMCNFEFELDRINKLAKLFEGLGIKPNRFLNKKKKIIKFISLD